MSRDYKDLVIEMDAEEHQVLREHIKSLVQDVDIYRRVADELMKALRTETARTQQVIREREALREDVALLHDDLSRLREDILRSGAA